MLGFFNASDEEYLGRTELSASIICQYANQARGPIKNEAEEISKLARYLARYLSRCTATSQLPDNSFNVLNHALAVVISRLQDRPGSHKFEDTPKLMVGAT